MKKIIVFVLTLTLVIGLGAIGSANSIGEPPQSQSVDINVNVLPWVRVSTPNEVTIEIPEAESGGFADFIASVRGNIAYTVDVALAREETPYFGQWEVALASTQEELPAAYDGSFSNGSDTSKAFDAPEPHKRWQTSNVVNRELWVRVGVSELDQAGQLFEDENSVIVTISATE